MSVKRRFFLATVVFFATLQVVCPAPSADNNDSEDTSGRLYRWIAIGCGAAINIVIGGYAGLTNILETEGRWTQRLEFVKDESKWWTCMSSVVLVAFAMDVVAFSKGESVDATILLLAAEVGIVIFVYVVQGTLHAEFRHLLWLAWTGKSRTGSELSDGPKLRDILAEGRNSSLMGKKIEYESKVDFPGYGAVLSPKLKVDVMTLLKKRRAGERRTPAQSFEYIGSSQMARKFVFPQQMSEQSKVSILWGGGDCSLFSPRVSRGITGYKVERIRSSYSLINVDEMKWMFVAGGIVARNKGLFPAKLICGLTEVDKEKGVAIAIPNNTMIDEVETTSKWRPRPAKTSRSQYSNESVSQFSGLGPAYCAAVVEIALLLQDVPNRTVIKALLANAEHQSSQKMWEIHDITHSLELQQAMYVCQYMTFCAKLNWYGRNGERPDLLMGMMYAATQGWNYNFNNEIKAAEILRRELDGLDLNSDERKQDFDILFCIAAYLGIKKDDRRDIFSLMAKQFNVDAPIQSIFSEVSESFVGGESELVLVDE